MNSIPILYVEDEETDVMLLRHVLEKAGISNPLQTVKDGKAAKDYLAGNGAVRMTGPRIRCRAWCCWT